MVVNFRHVVFHPHHLRQRVSDMRLYTGDFLHLMTAKCIDQRQVLFLPPGIGIQHRLMQGIPLHIGHYKGFTETRDSDSGNVRILLCHFRNGFKHCAKYQVCVDFVSIVISIRRILTISPPQILSDRIKHGTFTSCCTYINPGNLHIHLTGSSNFIQDFRSPLCVKTIACSAYAFPRNLAE